ncbi:MAG: Zn-ribbon domain-containing OB-fold protein [Anaerolineales bacterium]|nr:Zn-ribbon domain-containing OB-fold protein [Anaerolineales bacterium]
MNSHQLPGQFITAGVNLSFSYAAGETASRFLTALRDEQKIYGTRCPSCQRVLVPARSFCPRCFVETTEWIKVEPEGTLIAFASALASLIAHPTSLALIRLDGADTNLLHLLGEGEPEAWQIGMRIEAIFAAERVGSIRDILYFRPTKEQGG